MLRAICLSLPGFLSLGEATHLAEMGEYQAQAWDRPTQVTSENLGAHFLRLSPQILSRHLFLHCSYDILVAVGCLCACAWPLEVRASFPLPNQFSIKEDIGRLSHQPSGLDPPENLLDAPNLGLGPLVWNYKEHNLGIHIVSRAPGETIRYLTLSSGTWLGCE